MKEKEKGNCLTSWYFGKQQQFKTTLTKRSLADDDVLQSDDHEIAKLKATTSATLKYEYVRMYVGL